MEPSFSISADWIIPVNGPIIRDGVLRMRGGVIEAVGPRQSVPPAEQHEELGAVAVLPGLVNAHCHLELTDLRGRLPRLGATAGASSRRVMPGTAANGRGSIEVAEIRRGTPYGMAFWLAQLVRERKGLDFVGGARRGALELLAGGCTTVADISHDNSAWRGLLDLPIRKVCFAEVLGIGPLARGAMTGLKKSLENLPTDERLQFGVSPHAPYSTSRELYRQAIELARDRGMPLTTHLAESPEERRFLKLGTGPLARFLARLGIVTSQPAIMPGGKAAPMAFARDVGLLDFPSILAHVNYINDAELELLAAGRASVAYCPRCCEYFGRTGHRYAEMIARGVNVALGTDSLASNDSLDMLAEMRAVWRQGLLDSAAVLRMGTINGAKALGLDDRVGSLQPGMQADWIALPCVIAAGEDPLARILSESAGVARVVIAGEWWSTSL